MVVLVDGYNVTRFLFPRETASHEAELAFFLTTLARYRALKKEQIHEMIVVLDGGMFSHKTREIRKGIVVVYAGHGRKADDVLVEYGTAFRNGAILISNDRELQRRMAVHASESVGVAAFWDMVVGVCGAERSREEARQFGALIFTKYEHDDESNDMPGDIDELLISGSMGTSYQKCDSGQASRSRRGMNALSKKDKAVQAVRKKLG